MSKKQENESNVKFGDTLAKERGNIFSGFLTALDNARRNLFPNSLKRVLFYFLMGVLGFLLAYAKLPFEIYPLGIALICGAAKYNYITFLGVLLGSLATPDPILQVVFSILAFVARIAINKWVICEENGEKEGFFDFSFSEKINIRIIVALAITFSLGLTRIIKGGFVYYDIFAAIFALFCVALATYLYSLYFESEENGGILYEIGFYSILASVVIAFASVYFYSFSLNLTAAFFITVYISKNGGILKGCVIGLVLGLLCSPILAPLFALCGFIAGAFRSIGTFSSVLSAIVVGTAFGFYIDGIGAFSTILPELMLGGVAFLMLSFIAVFPKTPKWSIKKEAVDIVAYDIATKREAYAIEKIQSLSQSLKGLSDVFYNISETTSKPAIYDVKQLCDNTWQENCIKCPSYHACWENDYYSTADAVNKMVKTLYENTRITPCDIEESIQRKCKNASKIVSEINYKSAHLFESSAKRDKTEIFAFDYDTMAKILDEHIRENSESFCIDRLLSDKLSKKMKNADFSFQDAIVYGGNHKSVAIYGANIKAFEKRAYEIQRIASEICNQDFDMPEYIINDNASKMTLSPAKKISVECAVCGGIKENEKISGDTSGSLYDGHGNFYSFICDGMGSGREAAFTSRICKVFLEKMLYAKADIKLTLEMLNNFLRNKNTECCAAIDLMTVDLVYGMAKFIKGGAAESFICRNESIFKIDSTTPPIGIMRDIDTHQSLFELESGDIVILMSDGASIENNAMEIFVDITQGKECDAQNIAKRIFQTAERENKRTDDITVCVMKII